MHDEGKEQAKIQEPSLLAFTCPLTIHCHLVYIVCNALCVKALVCSRSLLNQTGFS